MTQIRSIKWKEKLRFSSRGLRIVNSLITIEHGYSSKFIMMIKGKKYRIIHNVMSRAVRNLQNAVIIE